MPWCEETGLFLDGESLLWWTNFPPAVHFTTAVQSHFSSTRVPMSVPSDSRRLRNVFAG